MVANASIYLMNSLYTVTVNDCIEENIAKNTCGWARLELPIGDVNFSQFQICVKDKVLAQDLTSCEKIYSKSDRIKVFQVKVCHIVKCFLKSVMLREKFVSRSDFR